MSVKATTLIVAALAYATFSDADLEKATVKLVEQLGSDLSDTGYEPSSDTESLEGALDDYMNSMDEARENLSAAINDSADDQDYVEEDDIANGEPV